MNPKTTIGLVVLLVISIVGVWWVQSSTSNTEDTNTSGGPTSLFDPPIGDLSAMEVVLDSGEPALQFVRKDEKWRITAPVKGPAEHWAVQNDADKIKNLKTVKAYGPDAPERPTDDMTGLDAPRRVVKLTDADGKAYVVKIGARQALSTNTYVQKEGDDTIYLVEGDLNQELKKRLSDYRGKRVAEFTQSDAIAVSVEGEQGWRLVKNDSKWTLERPVKARADSTQVNSLVASIANLNATAFVDDAPASLRPYGLDPPRLRVTVTTEKKTPKPAPEPPASAPAEPQFDIERGEVKLAFGASAEDKVFARLDDPDQPAVFQIAEATFKQIAKSVSDLRDKKIVEMPTGRVQSVTVTADGKTTRLAREPDGWKIVEGLGGSGPSDAELAAVDDLTTAVRNLTAIGFEDAGAADTGLAPPRVSLEMLVEGRPEPIRLSVGGQTPSETGAYVRNDTENFVAVVKAESVEPLFASPESFMSRDLLSFPTDQAVAMEIEYPAWTCKLAREDGEWRFKSPIEGRTESAHVQRIVGDLSALRGRKVVGTASDRARFGLDQPAARITVTAQPPAPPTPTTQPAESESPPPPAYSRTLLVAEKDGTVYGSLEGGRTVCEIDPVVLENLRAELYDTRVAVVEPSQVRRLSLRRAGDWQVNLEKQGDQWALEGEPTFKVAAAKVTEVLNALRDLRAQKYVRYAGANPADYGLEGPERIVETQSDDGTSMKLLISARGPEGGGRYAANAANVDRIFVIQDGDSATLDKKAADFQQ